MNPIPKLSGNSGKRFDSRTRQSRFSESATPSTPPLSNARSSSSITTSSLAGILPEPSQKSALRFFAKLASLPGRYALDEDEDDVIDLVTGRITPGPKGFLSKGNDEWEIGCFAPPEDTGSDAGDNEGEDMAKKTVEPEEEEDELDVINGDPKPNVHEEQEEEGSFFPKPSVLRVPPMNPSMDEHDAADLEAFLRENEALSKSQNQNNDDPDEDDDESDNGSYEETYEDEQVAIDGSSDVHRRDDPISSEEEAPRIPSPAKGKGKERATSVRAHPAVEDDDSDDMEGYDIFEGNIIKNVDGTVRAPSVAPSPTRAPSRARSRNASVKPLNLPSPSPRPMPTKEYSSKARDSSQSRSPPKPRSDARPKTPSRHRSASRSRLISDLERTVPMSPEVLPPPPTPPVFRRPASPPISNRKLDKGKQKALPTSPSPPTSKITGKTIPVTGKTQTPSPSPGRRNIIAEVVVPTLSLRSKSLSPPKRSVNSVSNSVKPITRQESKSPQSHQASTSRNSSPTRSASSILEQKTKLQHIRPRSESDIPSSEDEVQIVSGPAPITMPSQLIGRKRRRSSSVLRPVSRHENADDEGVDGDNNLFLDANDNGMEAGPSSLTVDRTHNRSNGGVTEQSPSKRRLIYTPSSGRSKSYVPSPSGSVLQGQSRSTRDAEAEAGRGREPRRGSQIPRSSSATSPHRHSQSYSCSHSHSHSLDDGLESDMPQPNKPLFLTPQRHHHHRHQHQHHQQCSSPHPHAHASYPSSSNPLSPVPGTRPEYPDPSLIWAQMQAMSKMILMYDHTGSPMPPPPPPPSSPYTSPAHPPPVYYSHMQTQGLGIYPLPPTLPYQQDFTSPATLPPATPASHHGSANGYYDSHHRSHPSSYPRNRASTSRAPNAGNYSINNGSRNSRAQTGRTPPLPSALRRSTSESRTPPGSRRLLKRVSFEVEEQTIDVDFPALHESDSFDDEPEGRTARNSEDSPTRMVAQTQSGRRTILDVRQPDQIGKRAATPGPPSFIAKANLKGKARSGSQSPTRR